MKELKISNKLNQVWLTSLLVFFILAGHACKNGENANSGSPEIQVVEHIVVYSDSVSVPVFAPGVLSSKTQSNLSFLTGGIIRSMNVQEGDEVKEGQLLAQLDMTEINSRLSQAKLGLEKAERDFTRAKNLYRDSIATREQYEDALTAFEFARNNQKIAEFNRKYSEIRAPGDGRILKKLKEIDEIAGPGYPVIVFASTEADWILKVSLADRDFIGIRTGDSAVVTFDAYPSRKFKAKVSEVANAANLLSGTYEVELKLLELPDQLVTGLIGNAYIHPAASSEIFLPTTVLAEAAGFDGVVFRLKGKKVERTSIRIKDILNDGILVESGIMDGDTLITAGNQWLKDGEIVSLKK